MEEEMKSKKKIICNYFNIEYKKLKLKRLQYNLFNYLNVL